MTVWIRPGKKRESCLSTRSTVYQKPLLRLCWHSFRIKPSEAIRSRRDGFWWQREILQEYNKSVREFDIVTLDRVRKLEIQPDCDTWLKYAAQQNVHQAVISYLSMKKERFYSVENTVDGKFFVTARGWEDLSRLIQSYEKLGIEVSAGLAGEFLQKEETAKTSQDFISYI